VTLAGGDLRGRRLLVSTAAAVGLGGIIGSSGFRVVSHTRVLLHTTPRSDCFHVTGPWGGGGDVRPLIVAAAPEDDGAIARLPVPRLT
jgi:hypothetical protein